MSAMPLQNGSVLRMANDLLTFELSRWITTVITIIEQKCLTYDIWYYMISLIWIITTTFLFSRVNTQSSGQHRLIPLKQVPFIRLGFRKSFAKKSNLIQLAETVSYVHIWERIVLPYTVCKIIIPFYLLVSTFSGTTDKLECSLHLVKMTSILWKFLNSIEKAMSQWGTMKKPQTKIDKILLK